MRASTTIQERVSRLEGIIEQMNERLGKIEDRFNTVYVLLGASWVTTMGAIIGLYFKN